jgi:hypothetical protein
MSGYLLIGSSPTCHAGSSAPAHLPQPPARPPPAAAVPWASVERVRWKADLRSRLSTFRSSRSRRAGCSRAETRELLANVRTRPAKKARSVQFDSNMVDDQAAVLGIESKMNPADLGGWDVVPYFHVRSTIVFPVSEKEIT